MKVELIKIGNSRGIRIPKPLIEQCGFGSEVNLRIENENLVISPDRGPRAGWEKQFRSAEPVSQDESLVDIGTNDFDRKEWRW